MAEFGEHDAVAPNAPVVVSETIDGEAIIMHHGTGRYFDASGPGGMLWAAIEGVTTPALLATRLADACEVDAATAGAAVARFLATLAGHGLIVARPDTAPGPLAAPATMAFAEPALGVHDDLADMLLLDPIHDVDAAGWPAARPQAA